MIENLGDIEIQFKQNNDHLICVLEEWDIETGEKNN